MGLGERETRCFRFWVDEKQIKKPQQKRSASVGDLWLPTRSHHNSFFETEDGRGCEVCSSASTAHANCGGEEEGGKPRNEVEERGVEERVIITFYCWIIC